MGALRSGSFVFALAALLLGAFGTSAALAGNDKGNDEPEFFIALSTREAHAAKGKPPKPQNVNLFSHGGAVQTATRVYVSYWGADWATGFTTGAYTSAQAQTYISAFFGNVGGSSWINTDTQYCRNVPARTTTCPATATFITNPAWQLAGTWIDATPVPSQPTQSDIATAAVRLSAQFGYSANATYMVFTPTHRSMNGFGTRWCAWHSATSGPGGSLAYAYMPYQPDAGGSCGMNFVNRTNDSFGHGYFDAFSVVGGHEYEEVQTDPFPSSGWLDAQGAEAADKCAWSSQSGNISLGGTSFAVQPIWSNASSGCAMSYP